jgi:endonuclease YncB( thermonuclease family)
LFLAAAIPWLYSSFCCVLFWAVPPISPEESAVIIDGDTFEVLDGHHADRIRLSGIDCSEKNQA